MELGNMIFGNSRGEKPIPRNASFEGPWEEFCEELKVNWRGYPDEGCQLPVVDGVIDTPVFRVRSYDWDSECDCGADDNMERWFSKNKHSQHCYQTECKTEMAAHDCKTGYALIEAAAFGRDESPFRGFDQDVEHPEPGVTLVSFEPRSDAAMNAWREANEVRRKFEDELRKRLCKERGLTYPSGCAVHCDCGRDKSADIYWEQLGGHKPACRLVQPNFLYKPTGFRINWYKYPFRDSYMTPGISAAQWRKIVRHCIESSQRLTGGPGETAR